MEKRELSTLDRIIAKLSPEKALKREAARQRLEFLNSGYSHHGADRRKKSNIGWDSSSNSPDEDINANLDTMRERNRDLYMGGAPIATGAIKTIRTNVVGSGLILKPAIDPIFLKMTEEEAEAWKVNVVREFDYWAKSVNCDMMRKSNFYELQQLAFLSMLLSGDVFALLPYKERKNFLYDLRVQLIESDRIGTPADKFGNTSISQGVELKNGEVANYFIFKKHPGSASFNPNDYVRVPAFGSETGRRNVLHLMEMERPEQTRGVPILAPVIEALRQLGQYTHAELQAAVISGLFTVFVHSEMPEIGLGEGLPIDEQIDADDEYSYELGYGTIVNTGVGEKIDTATPGRPNVAFDGFVNAILRQIGAALEIPYELLIKHFSASYSASRAALLEAWKMFRMRRTWMANAFCQPVYEEWLREAVAKGRIHAPGFFNDLMVQAAYCKAEWHGPAQGQIDPLKEANAAKIRINENLSTGEKEAAEITGTDYSANIKQRIREETMKKPLKILQADQNGGDSGNE